MTLPGLTAHVKKVAKLTARRTGIMRTYHSRQYIQRAWGRTSEEVGVNSIAMLAAVDRYAALLDASGAVPVRADVNQEFAMPRDRLLLLNHARWRLEMVRRVLNRLGGESTAVRVLGSAQGILVATGLLTVGETWRDNAEWLSGASVRAFDSAMYQIDQRSGTTARQD